MSSDQQVTTSEAPLLVPSTEPSQEQRVAKENLKATLKEARNNRDMLVGFRAAVETGTYHGSKMLEIAKGLAFLEAILNQNNAHISNLQERIDHHE